MARTAVVTGGTRGIGEAISIALRDAGMTVAANYAGNEEKARAFTGTTGIKSYRWDVADYEACVSGVQQIEAALGPIDVLVNNAGITRDATMRKMTHDMWQEVMDVNLGGCFNMAKAVFDGRRETSSEAQEAFRLASLRFSRGLSTQLEVSDAQLALLTAEGGSARATYDLYLATAEMARALGRPIPMPVTLRVPARRTND